MDIREKLILDNPEIGEAPSWISVPIHWGDMDAAQHVNNLIYLRWTETSRIEFFKSITIDTGFNDGVGPILGWMDAKYIRPVTYPDTVLVTTQVHDIRTDRIVLISKIYSATQNKIVALSHQEIIPYNYQNLRKVSIPKNWLQGIKALQPNLRV